MRKKMMKRKRIGEKMLGIGAGMLLLFGSGLDCPGNSMTLLCGGMTVGLALMYAGAHIADLWM